MTGALFKPKTIRRLCEDIELSEKQIKAAKEWLDLLKQDKLKEERANYFRFGTIVLKDILDYSIRDMDFETDNVEFQFNNDDGKKIICFEVKGTKIKDLHAIQHRPKKEHETPIKQTWNYMGNEGLDYGVCTNYEKFILITKELGYSKEHIFDFTTIENNEEKLKEFIGIFSKQRIIDDGFVEKLYNESITEEREFTKEFYKLYHETRLMLKMEFEEKNGSNSSQALYFTQLFLNRLIFIFFVEDRGFISDNHLFTNTILNGLKSGTCNEHTQIVYNAIKALFSSFDKGSTMMGVFGFNGGLFNGVFPEHVKFDDLKNSDFFKDVKQYSNLLKSTKLDEKASEILGKHERLNPIISNLLIMDSFDFNTEVNVNILGHVFEQSISDLEELKKSNTSRRKKDGVYYTPEHITDYICRNTIIPYLSKSNVTTVSDLINEYEDESDLLEQKLKTLTILDPACGSGAFLMKAIDILLEINREIQNKKYSAITGTQLQITHEWDEEAEIRRIIESNIYGVDINPESIEITKLSLFLKLASNERKLSELSKSILKGNSLIEDRKITPDAFSWGTKFRNILDPSLPKVGFDIVIGNPPYFNLEANDILKNSPNYTELNSNESVMNVASLFIKKGIILLTDNGYLGFIIPKSFLIVNSWKSIRDFVLNHSLFKVNDVGKQWVDVGLEQTIIILQKNPQPITTEILAKFRHVDNISQTLFKKRGMILTWLDEEKLSFVEKIEKNAVRLDTISDMPRGTTVTSSEYAAKSKHGFVQVLGGTNMERFLIKDGNKRKPNRYLKTNDPRITSKTFSEKRILYQNVASSIPKIVAAIESEKRPTDDTINNLILFDKSYSYEDIVAILNSDLITFYLRYAIINNSELTVHLDKPYLGKIPIKNPNNQLSGSVLTISKIKKEIKGQNTKFFNRVREIFSSIKITKKLSRYYEMNFSDFIQELEKGNRKLSLKERDDWEDYFNDYSKKISSLMTQVEIANSDINKQVFKLYGFSEEESETITNII